MMILFFLMFLLNVFVFVDTFLSWLQLFVNINLVFYLVFVICDFVNSGAIIVEVGWMLLVGFVVIAIFVLLFVCSYWCHM